MSKPVLVILEGVHGSGKTTTMKLLKNLYSEDQTIGFVDENYLDQRLAKVSCRSPAQSYCWIGTKLTAIHEMLSSGTYTKIFCDRSVFTPAIYNYQSEALIDSAAIALADIVEASGWLLCPIYLDIEEPVFYSRVQSRLQDSLERRLTLEFLPSHNHDIYRKAQRLYVDLLRFSPVPVRAEDSSETILSRVLALVK